jgi:hypothetical protein
MSAINTDSTFFGKAIGDRKQLNNYREFDTICLKQTGWLKGFRDIKGFSLLFTLWEGKKV